MRVLTPITFVLLCVLSAVATGVDAQDSEYPPMAAFGADGQLWLYGFGDEPQRMTDDLRCQISFYPCDLVWNDDGTMLAVAANTEDGRRYLMLLDIAEMSLTRFAINPLHDFPISFSLDGNHVIYADDGGTCDSQSPDCEFFYWADIYAVAVEANSAPELIGYFQYDNSTGGRIFYPVDETFWYETGRDVGFEYGQSGFDRLLYGTSFGIIHTSGIWGSGVVQLYDSQTDEDVDLPYRPSGVVLSPDKTRLAGVTYDDGQIVVIDLATQDTLLIAPNHYPNLLAWGSDDTLCYSTRTLRENRLERFSTEQQQIFIERTLAERIPAYEVEIWQLDLTNNQSMLLYHADAYAIGRLMPAPDGITLFFSEIPNMDDELVNAIVDNVTVDVGTWPEPIPPLLYRLNLADDSVELIATDLSSATINFPAYERMMLDESQQRP